MRTGDETCADIELRLVDGQRPGDDPALAMHLRSCLRCFRAASELREVPQIAAKLREDQAAMEPDPGDLFWAKFPHTVADVWERRQATAAPRRSPWKRVGGWLRLPVPAALGGAALAAALMLIVHRPHPAPRTPATSAPLAVRTTPVTGEASSLFEDEPAAGLLGEEDPLEVLELADARVVAKLGGEPAAQGSEEGDLVPSAVEEVELLEADDLRAVEQALRGRTRI
jgi:hypothetical protein